ncbi:hypothetical protein OE88DRAFT_1729050 [Heliocybe sulcata]|uniref:Uncharacterized protein n=1 Tax=Heliocybe sulcata TaxID=5364 RepID=A0A5C3MRW5_9AGAM|nr:hypothetical protein OE88DRAFT_1729050 [Heliocybe sulcata]
MQSKLDRYWMSGVALRIEDVLNFVTYAGDRGGQQSYGVLFTCGTSRQPSGRMEKTSWERTRGRSEEKLENVTGGRNPAPTITEAEKCIPYILEAVEAVQGHFSRSDYARAVRTAREKCRSQEASSVARGGYDGAQINTDDDKKLSFKRTESMI